MKDPSLDFGQQPALHDQRAVPTENVRTEKDSESEQLSATTGTQAEISGNTLHGTQNYATPNPASIPINLFNSSEVAMPRKARQR
jgi:hypothetical protein